MSTYKTVDEIRAEEDLPPLPDGEGEVILNAVWMQNKTMAAQAEMGVGDFAEEPQEDEFGNELDGIQAENGNGGDDEGVGDDKGGDDSGSQPAEPAKPVKAEKSFQWFRSPDGLLLHSPTPTMQAAELLKGQTPQAPSGRVSVDLDL